MARFYEQKLISNGKVIDRFFSHGSKEGRNIAAENKAGVPCATYHRLWQEENFEDMEVGTVCQFSGCTVLARIA